MLPNDTATHKLSKAESARVNGARSRGPVTPQGVANSARANLKHGAYSKRILMDGENAEAYEYFRATFCEYFRPSDPFEAECLDAMISARWRIRRIESMETTLLDHALLTTKPAVDAQFEVIDPVQRRGVAVHSQLQDLDTSSKVQERLQRIYDRNYRLLAAHRRNKGQTVPSSELPNPTPPPDPDSTIDPNSQPSATPEATQSSGFPETFASDPQPSSRRLPLNRREFNRKYFPGLLK